MSTISKRTEKKLEAMGYHCVLVHMGECPQAKAKKYREMGYQVRVCEYASGIRGYHHHALWVRDLDEVHVGKTAFVIDKDSEFKNRMGVIVLAMGGASQFKVRFEDVEQTVLFHRHQIRIAKGDVK